MLPGPPLFVLLSVGIASCTKITILKAWEKCGTIVNSACEAGTRCSTGIPSVCVPIFSDNSTFTYTDVTGYGRPAFAVVPDGTADDPIPVFTACSNAQFSGSCWTWSVACDFCAVLPADEQDVYSSIAILDTRVGCNFWVNTNCVGDGINIDSGAIYDLSATNYNDRTVAYNCYLTGR